MDQFRALIELLRQYRVQPGQDGFGQNPISNPWTKNVGMNPVLQQPSPIRSQPIPQPSPIRPGNDRMYTQALIPDGQGGYYTDGSRQTHIGADGRRIDDMLRANPGVPQMPQQPSPGMQQPKVGMPKQTMPGMLQPNLAVQKPSSGFGGVNGPQQPKTYQTLPMMPKQPSNGGWGNF